MAHLNNILISNAQDLNIHSDLALQTKGKDLNYLGYDIFNPEIPFEVTGKNASLNRALFWLSSKKGDYGRRYLDKGGILYELLGKLSSNTNLRTWETAIQEKFNEEFKNDLEMININLYMDSREKILYIDTIVKDKMTNKAMRIQKGAQL